MPPVVTNTTLLIGPRGSSCNGAAYRAPEDSVRSAAPRSQDRSTPLLSAHLTSPRSVFAILGALVVAGTVFALWPGLDIWAAARFVTGEGRFVGQGASGDVARRVLSTMPFVVLAVMALLYLLRRLRLGRLWAPDGAGLAVAALSLALGPGLLVNVVLKDHSHRPRPYYIQELGGPYEFRPYYRFDGQCVKNCSFASGEGATGFWLVAPALLVPAPLQPAALAAALAIGTATSLLRMAFGGHFFSDTVFAALLTWLVVGLCWQAAFRITGRRPGPEGAGPLP